MRLFVLCCVAGVPMMASAALGADVEAGKRLAQQRCAVCHVVGPNQRDEVARHRRSTPLPESSVPTPICCSST